MQRALLGLSAPPPPSWEPRGRRSPPSLGPRWPILWQPVRPRVSSLPSSPGWIRPPSSRLGDDDYPGALLQNRRRCSTPWRHPPPEPAGLRDRGERNATRQGALDAHEFARALSDEGYGIVSGLALGIDAAAHRGGLSAARPPSRSSAPGWIACSRIRRPTGTSPTRSRSAASWCRSFRRSAARRGEFSAAQSSHQRVVARRARRRGGAEERLAITALPPSTRAARYSPSPARSTRRFPRVAHWLIKQGAKLVESADDVLAELSGRPLPDTGPEPPSRATMTPCGPRPFAGKRGRARASHRHRLPRSAADLAPRPRALCGGLFRQLAHPDPRSSGPKGPPILAL